MIALTRQDCRLAQPKLQAQHVALGDGDIEPVRGPGIPGVRALLRGQSARNAAWSPRSRPGWSPLADVALRNRPVLQAIGEVAIGDEARRLLGRRRKR